MQITHEARQVLAGQKCIGQKKFSRCNPRQCSGERTGPTGFRQGLHPDFARRHVEPCQTKLATHLGTGRQIIVASGIKQRVLTQRPGGDDTHDRAANDRLRTALFSLGRIFHLLADGHAMPGPDQARQVLLGGMNRNAGHWNRLTFILTTLGQGDIETCRGCNGIIKKQFVEISHPEKQEAIRILRLCRMPLGQHRRGGWCCCSLGGRCGALNRHGEPPSYTLAATPSEPFSHLRWG